MPITFIFRECGLMLPVALHKLLVALLVATITCGRSAPVLAEKESDVPTVTLDTLRAHAFSKSPLVAGIDVSFANQVSNAIETSLIQNPLLQGQVQSAEANSGMRPDDRFSASLSQPLRLGDFGTRNVVAGLLKKAATQQQQFALLELNQRILLQYVTLWALHSRANFISKMKIIADRKAVSAVKGKNRGLLGASEVKLLQGAAARLTVLELSLRADVSSTEASLTSLTGFPFMNYRVERPKFNEIPSLEEALSASETNNLGVRRRVDLLQTVAKKQSELAKLESFSGFTPSLIYDREDNSNFIGFGVSFELPFSDRNQGEILRRKQKTRELQTRQRYLGGSAFQVELKTTLNSVRLKYLQATTYARDVLPLFEGALKGAERQFESGQTSVLQLWQAFTSLIDANEEQLMLWVNAYGARSKLSLMLGEE